jgi:hypothetical protein
MPESIIQLTSNAIAVRVPKDFIQCLGFNQDELMLLCKSKDDPYPIGLDDVDSIKLAPGPWKLLGKGNEIGREECLLVVEQYTYSGRSSYYAYKDYSGKKPESEDDIITDPIESFTSLLRSLNLPPDEVVVLVKI